MATQYTPILQLALPVTGELNGTWGDVVNDNITSMVEQAIAGLATINTWTTNSHTLTTADGTTDEARCAMLVAQTGAGGTALTGAGEIICPARTKLFVLQNGSAYAVTLKTSAGTGIAVAAGDTAFLFCDGTNVNACVTQIVNGHITGNLTVDGNTTLGNTTSDTITATARIASDLNPSADNTYDLGTSGNSWRNLYIDGTATIASLVATTADINGGTVDNATIGATTASTGRFTQVNITGQGDLRLEDTTGGEYVALQAPGTLSASYTLTLPVDDGTNGQALITDGSGNLSWSTAASGDVYGPASATDNAVARFDLTTGKIIQNSVMTIADDGASVLSVNSASDGLRITQTGTGNALVVEDSANPDTTPFVVGSSGKVGIGLSPAYTNAKLQIFANDYEATTFNARGTNDSAAFSQRFYKTRSTNIYTQAIVQNGDVLGEILFSGDDGVTAGVVGAAIAAAVDGTPGTNDMPGRLVFSTTADGASSPTERMRIDSAGNVGVGGTAFAGAKTRVTGSTSAVATSYSVYLDQAIQSGVTASYTGISTGMSVANTVFTLPELRHFYADQGTKGASATVTNQYGFNVASSLTGATNNYGFYSNIASGTGRWNFYAAGTANNYFAGSIGVGNTSPASKLHVSNASTVLLTIENTSSATGFLVFRNTTQTANAVRIGSDANDFVAYTGTIERLRIDSSGNILNVSTGGLGYGTGSGGAVTQTTSRTQGVTLNRTNGAITLVSAAGSATTQSFTVTNSTVAATDTIIVNQKSGTDLYEIHITAVAAGSFRISFKTTGGTTTEQPVFNFAVIKAVTA